MLPHPQNQSYTAWQMNRLTKLKKMKGKKHTPTITESSVSTAVHQPTREISNRAQQARLASDLLCVSQTPSKTSLCRGAIYMHFCTKADSLSS